MEPKQHLFSIVGSYDERLNKKTTTRDETYGDLTELMIIIGKSLVNDKKTEKLRIDVPRLKEELILWKHYREGSIECFLLNNNDRVKKSLTSTGITCILPLIIGNYDTATLERELGNFVCQTKQKSDNLMLFLLMGKLVHEVINQEIDSDDSFIKILKEYLIHLNYDRIFQEISKEKRIDKISFEKEKIRWIMELDRVSEKEVPRKKDIEGNSQILFIQSIHLFLHHEEKHFFENIESLEVSDEAKMLSLLLMDLKFSKKASASNQRTQENVLNFGENHFLKEMDRYFTKLKNFEIIKKPYCVDKLKDNDYTDTKGLFLMKQGEIGIHPILKDFEIIRKEIVKNYLCLEVKTKSRNYKLKKPLAQR